MIPMTEDSTLIKHLNRELNAVDNYTQEDVFNVFEKYIADKVKLQKVIDFGLLYYDYASYKVSIEGTLFEDGLAEILRVYNCALKQNQLKSIQIFKDSYPAVTRGFASWTQIIRPNGVGQLPNRFDLFVKTAFQLIGDGVENSLKPYLEFLDAIYHVSRDKPVVKKKLGVIVDGLMANSKLFKALYKTLFLDITVSQWRNIADHGSYTCNSDGKIEIHYGQDNSITKYIERQDLERVLATLDTLLYMHKTAYTLMHIDHIDHIPTIEKYYKTENDDLVMQIVETSYAHGLEVFAVERGSWNIAALIRKQELTPQDLKRYCAAIATFLYEEKFSVLIYKGSQVKYQIIYDQRKAKIYEYAIHDENHEIEEI